MTKPSIKKAAPAAHTPASRAAKVAGELAALKAAPARSRAKKPGPVVLRPKTITKKMVAKAKAAAARPEPPAPKPARKSSRVKVSKEQKARKAAQTAYEAASDARLRGLAKRPKTAAAEPGDAEESPAQRTVKLIPADIRLIRDPRNGIALLQLEKTSPAGAVCVYNNGTRVAAGVIGEDTLRFVLRPEPGSPSITEAAYQLLNPVVPTVQVTDTANAHLTAVLNSKEISAMSVTETTETPVARSKKFAAPAAKKARAVAKKAAKAEAAEKPARKGAPAKKAAAKKEKTAPSGAGRAALFAPEAKIKILQKENPGREGTKRHGWYELYRASKTVADYIAAGGDRGYLKYDSEHGFISIG